MSQQFHSWIHPGDLKRDVCKTWTQKFIQNFTYSQKVEAAQMFISGRIDKHKMEYYPGMEEINYWRMPQDR